jgi:hypothetical protein
VTELEIQQADRFKLTKYLTEHVYPSAGAVYRINVQNALAAQSLQVLRNMAILTCRQELERQKRRQDQRAFRRKDEHKHTTTRGAR